MTSKKNTYSNKLNSRDYISLATRLRLVATMLLMLVVGVSEMWGAFTEGLYYIRSNSNAAYYLCPSIGCYYDNNVDQPHLTTFQTGGDQYSIWKIVPTGETDTYYIIHYKTGRYLKSNENFTTVEKGATKNNRKAVHLEVKPETLTDDFKFLIKNNSSPYQIYPKVYWNTDVANMSFNPTNEHQDCYAPADGAVENGGAKGMIGLYSKTDNFSKWQIPSVASAPCATPIIKYDGDNINISYPYSDETGITIYYTTDGSDPSTGTSNASTNFNISASGVIKVRAIATKTGFVNSDEAVLWGSARPLLIQSKECADYYLVPTGNGTNVNTSSLPGTSMQWTLQNAGASTGGVQYYYVVNSNNKIIKYNSSDNSLTLNEESADANKFCVFENGYGTGNFFLIPVSQTNRVLYKNNGKVTTNKGNAEANDCNAGLNKKWDTNLDQWNLRACNETADQKNLFSAAPFSVSNDDETHYYHIASVGQNGYYIVPPAEADGYATTSNTDYNNTPWLFKVAASDNWLTYYYIINAASGKYMYFNPNNNQTADQENVISLKEISEKNVENEEKFQFIMVRSTTTDACYIVPKGYSYADASHRNFYNNKYFGVWANESGPLKSTWSRASSANHVKWTFNEATITDLYLAPVFSQDESGNITITHPTAACDIHYTIDGTEPSTFSAVYDNTNGLSSTEQRIIKAKAKLKTNSSIVSDVATLLNKPDFTLSQDIYEYSGGANEPDVTEVSIGEGENKTTATKTTHFTLSYSNNIKAGTPTSENPPTVILVDVAGDDMYVWNASKTFTINKKPITITAASESKDYDGTALTKNTYTNTDLAIGDAITSVTFAGTQTVVGESSNVPSAAVIKKGEEDRTACYEITYANGTLTVNKKALTITADSDTKVYDGTALTKNSYTNTALADGDAITSVTVTGSQTVVGVSNNVPSATVIMKGEEDRTACYEITYTNGTLTISPKVLTITADAKSKTYGDDDPALTYTSEGLINDDPITGTLSREVGEDVGVYAITQGGLTAGNNYVISYTGANLTITKVGLTVTANNNTITYGDAPAGSGVTYAGFVNSETESVLGGSLDYEYNYSQFGDVGNNYTITPKGLTSTNYDITFVAGTLTVGQKEVGLTWNETTFEYDGSAHAPTATATDLVNSDEIGVTVTGAQTNAGENYTATASALTGDKAGNYKLPTDNTQSFTITQKSIGMGSLAYGYILDLDENNTILLTDDVIGCELVLDTDYSVSDDSNDSPKYSQRTVTGIGNYTGSFDVRNVVISLTTDTDQEEWSATFIEENAGGFDIELGLALPEGVSAFIISGIQGDWAIPEPLNYIPKGVPVLLVAHKKINGFVLTKAESGDVTPIPISDDQKDRNMLEIVTADTPGYDAVTESAPFATKQIYLLYKNEFVSNKAGNMKKGKVYLNPNHITPSSEPAPARLLIAWNYTTDIQHPQDGSIAKTQDDIWYTIDGRRLSSQPTAKGLYIVNGNKVVIK